MIVGLRALEERDDTENCALSLRLRGTLRKYAHQPVLAAPQNIIIFLLKINFFA